MRRRDLCAGKRAFVLTILVVTDKHTNLRSRSANDVKSAVDRPIVQMAGSISYCVRVGDDRRNPILVVDLAAIDIATPGKTLDEDIPRCADAGKSFTCVRGQVVPGEPRDVQSRILRTEDAGREILLKPTPAVPVARADFDIPAGERRRRRLGDQVGSTRGKDRHTEGSAWEGRSG